MDRDANLVDTTYAAADGGQEYLELLNTAQRDGKCPFCPESLEKNNEVIYEAGGITYGWILILNLWPYQNAAHHLLIIPRRHIAEFKDIRAND